MSRYTDASCRLCRREGEKLFLKGQRCYTDKCAVARRTYAPGQHGAQNMRRKTSEYGLQLREKQKTKRFYGLQEGQFRTTYEKAERLKGATGVVFLQMLELRFDNIAYRMGLGSSRSEARQLVTHGHFLVNGKKANIPSMQLSPGDVISVSKSSKQKPRFAEFEMDRTVPAFLSFDDEQLEGRILQVPTREEIDIEVEERLIVELYSR